MFDTEVCDVFIKVLKVLAHPVKGQFFSFSEWESVYGITETENLKKQDLFHRNKIGSRS